MIRIERRWSDSHGAFGGNANGAGVDRRAPEVRVTGTEDQDAVVGLDEPAHAANHRGNRVRGASVDVQGADAVERDAACYGECDVADGFQCAAIEGEGIGDSTDRV